MRAPKRLNARQRREIYQQLIDRDGECCRICGGPGYFKQGPNQLEIDRLIPVTGYGVLSNLQLAHHDCNSAKNKRGKGKFHPSRTKTFDDIDPKRVNTVEMEKHLNAYKPFCRWLIALVGSGPVPAGKKLLNDAAWKFNVTQQTIQRYVDAISSDLGPLMIDESAQPPVIVFRTSGEEGEGEARAEAARRLEESMGPS